MFKKISLIIFISLVCPLFVHAATTLYLDPDKGEHGPGDTFGVNIRASVDQCVNTVEGIVSFPSDVIKFADFSSGQSIMSLWVKNPNKSDSDQINTDGKIYFAGGMPGGYCGKIPGDPGDSDIIGKIIFAVPSLTKNDNAAIQAKVAFLPDTAVYLNDGFGTKDVLTTKDASFIISNKESLVKEEWQGEIAADKIKPEPFIVELDQDPSVADGKYYVMYSTTDKQTGIDHYEVLEIRPGEILGEKPQRSVVDVLLGKKAEAPVWKTVSAPYILNNQDLSSNIRVKAVDKAGNERIVEYIPPVENSNIVKKNKNISLYVIISIIVIMLGVIAIIVKKRFSKK